MTALNNLLFRVSLLDAMSGPAQNMMNNMNRVTSGVQSGLSKIGYGTAGMMGAVYTLENITDAAGEMDKALGEVRSLDVAQQVLDDLSKTALDFSVQYGESAVDFVRSSYQIQSAISGLSGNDLSAFTNASGILAKGTKADIGTITTYVGTMYGIFHQNAEAMGKSNWVNQLAGQTATAVQLFKTTGQEMSSAFTTLGAGTPGHIAMSEQIAILGTLQATMSGSEAGTKYKAFLGGVGKAQKELGLNFTDSQGRMLPMIDILGKINGKFGAIDTVAESDLLTKAFGTEEAVALIKLLSTNVDGLSGSIAKVGEQTGLQKAMDMADAMTDAGDRTSSAITALKIVVGQTMLPTMDLMYNGVTDVANKLIRWAELFPNITQYIGYAILAVIGIIAALSALSVVVGVGMLVMTGFGLVMAIIASPITATIVAITGIGYAIYRLLDIWAQWAYGMSIFDTMAAGYEAAKLGVVSMIETTVAAFTGLKDWFNNFNLWEALLSGADALIGLLNKIPGVNIDLGGAINPATQPPALEKLATPATVAGPQAAAPSLSAMAAQPKWLQQPAPGLLSDGFAPPQPVAPPVALSQSQSTNVPKGGLMSQINNADNSKSVSVGGITVNNYGQPVTGQRLADEIAMAAG